MAAIRKVPLKLGLISVTVKVATAIEDATPRFNTVCDQGHAPNKVKQRLECPSCQSSERGAFKKGVEQGDGTVIVVEADKVAEASEVPDDIKQGINLTTHPADDLVGTTMVGGKVYFLEPNQGEHDTYALMTQLVEERTDVAMLASFAIRSKPSLYRLGTLDGALTLTEIAWPESVRPAPRHQGTVDDAMLKMAAQFVDTLVAPFDPNEYRDTRSTQLADFLSKQKAVASGDEEAVVATSGDDLMAALSAAVTPKKKPAKKAAKKATAKKAATKKAS